MKWSRPLASTHPVVGRAAVFLDRDGTLIEDRGPLLDPTRIELLPGAASALRQLAAANYRRILVTNQSAIGRGLLDQAGLERIHESLRRALDAEGATLDAIYFCPDPPDPQGDSEDPSAFRKPGAGMLLQAAREHSIDLSRSWMIGDQVRDTIAGRRARCRGSLLVRTGQGSRFESHRSDYDQCCDDLEAAVDVILSVDSTRNPSRTR